MFLVRSQLNSFNRVQNALGILSIPGREGGGRSDESEERPRAFSSLVVTVLAGSQLLGRSLALFLFCSGSVALNLALLTGSVWRSHDRHYTQEYSFHFSRMSGGRE